MNYDQNDLIPKIQTTPLIPIKWENLYDILLYKINNGILNVDMIYPDEMFGFLHDRIVPGIKPYSYIISNYGRLYTVPYNKFMRFDHDKFGYFRVELPIYVPDQCIFKKRHFFVHRLVLSTFSDTCYYNQLQVNHKDGNIYNNHISNLEWCTGAENLHHMHYILHNFRDNYLPDDIVKGVCEDLVKKLPFKEISKRWGVSEYQIYGIKSKIRYKEISQNYTFEKYSEKTPEDIVHKICQDLQDGVPGYIIANTYQCSPTTVSGIKHRRSFKEIGSNYKF